MENGLKWQGGKSGCGGLCDHLALKDPASLRPLVRAGALGLGLCVCRGGERKDLCPWGCAEERRRVLWILCGKAGAGGTDSAQFSWQAGSLARC